MAQKTRSTAVVVDLRRCMACRSCQLACAKAHAGFDDIVEALLSGADLVPRVHLVSAEGMTVPVQCQHCEDAPCVAVCPSGALYRDEQTGAVRAAPERCIGCKACVIVCPFGAAHYDSRSRRVIRCDLCADIIEAGEVPRCVAACPTHARRVVDIEGLTQKRRDDAARRTIHVYQAQRGGEED
ncbi:MAG: hypothetical protein AMK73_10120 [Planctomycetes bacterium SM23_32]|nr:MAG: hypothetical protein AMK73_10120 [Planctomycetes bacterium SM23_32]